MEQPRTHTASGPHRPDRTTRTFRRFSRTLLTATTAAALTAAIGGPVSASAATASASQRSVEAAANPGGHLAQPGGRVTITGTITWKQTTSFNNPGEAGSDIQTGTFKVDLISTVPPPVLGQAWHNVGSTYQVTDDLDHTVGAGTSCALTYKGSANTSGSLVDPGTQGPKYHNLFADFGPPDTPWVGFDISIQADEKQTTTDCHGTTTATALIEFLPECFSVTVSGLPGITGKLKGNNDTGTIPINCSGTTPSPDPITYSASGTLTVSSICAPPDQPSGPSWASKFPQSKEIKDLSGKFRDDVTRFVDAMRRASITVKPLSTLRPPERAYLMHYSWLIAKKKLEPTEVPAFVPQPGESQVHICWVHFKDGIVDLPASVKAASQLADALGIDKKLKVAPALRSLHTRGLAIDMLTTWSKHRITIVNGHGHKVTIDTGPHDGLNHVLIEVGATYSVIHFLNASKDPNHWSVNGH